MTKAEIEARIDELVSLRKTMRKNAYSFPVIMTSSDKANYMNDQWKKEIAKRLKELRQQLKATSKTQEVQGS